MSEETRTCPKCGGEMRAGILIYLDHKSLLVKVAEQIEWVEGDSSQRSGLTGGIKLTGKERRKVVTHCCNACGFLESFAR